MTTDPAPATAAATPDKQNNHHQGGENKGGRGRGRGGHGRGRGMSGGRGRGRGGDGAANSKNGKSNDQLTNSTHPKNKKNDNASFLSETNGQNSSRASANQSMGTDGNNNDSKSNNNGGRGRGGGRGGKGGRGGGGGGRGGDRGEANKNKEKKKDDSKPKKETKNGNDTSSKTDKNSNINNNKKPQTKGTKAAAPIGNQKPSNKNKKNSDSNTTTNNNKPPGTSCKPSIPPSQSQQTSDIQYGRGESITVLHVGEKPSIAEAIAKGLCRNGDRTVQKKIAMPIHTFTDPPFPKAPHAKRVHHKVTSVAGHVFSVDFPQEYQSWESVDPAELFHAPIKRKPCQGSVVRHLQNEAKGVDFICLWLDCDREGENIAFEVLDCCMHLMKGGGGVAHYDRVYRAYFSAVNPSDILKAYNALGKPDKNQALSVDARQELDLKVGVAFSRFQTRFFQGRYGDLDSSVLSYGPCQTPTMGFVVQRHVDIETFKPEPYWVLELGVLKRGRLLRALWESGRSFQKAKTEALVHKALEASPTAVVINVVIKDKKQGRPVPLNTVGLLKACSKALGIGPHQAMQSAERLYLSGYLSYPRTESTAYPKSFDIKGTLQQQTNDGRWGAYVRELLAKGHNNSRGGVDMGDHPPITPMRSAAAHELSGDMARVFDLVVRHFIASVSPDAVWRSTKVTFSVDALGEKGIFYLTGKENVSPGFLAILLHKEYGEEAGEGDDEDEEERSIPEFTKGETIPIIRSNVGASSSSSSSSKVNVATSAPVWGSLDVKEKLTTPPGYLTESELIGKMEKDGIGTDASIATHIENIQKRNYVRLETGRRLVPNKLGMVLVQGYHQIDSGLVLPKVRADIEGQCNKIAKGEMEKDEVIKRALKFFEEKFQYFVKNIDRMDILFGSSFSKLEDVGKPFTRCGLSRRYLQFIPGPPARLYNKYTETVYPMPSGGEIKQWSGRTCPVEGCNFELCLYSVGAPPRTFPLCPNCFNSSDWALEEPQNEDDKEDENMERQKKRLAGKNLILECPLPDNHPLIDELYVSPDPDSDGIFILDPHFGPKWRLVGTRDATIIYLPKSIDKMTVLNETDEVTGCHKIKIEFKSRESPLDGGETKYKCFFPTDKILQDSSRVFHGSERTAGGGRGRGGRGRGRGRGGRGGRGMGGRR